MAKRFSKLLGNAETKKRLADTIISSTLPHALLIIGPEGSGKRTLAYEICAAANCEPGRSSGNLPCGECNTCKRIYSDNFPDVRFLEKSSGKATIGVEELRDFREDMFLSSTESSYKFYIIDGAELLTPAAQNALLKVLEEPPVNVHIILLAEESDKILTTIKSRAQYIQTERFSYDELKMHTLSLMKSGAPSVSEEKLRAILLASGGVIGKALTLLSDDKNDGIEQRRATVLEFLFALPKKSPFSRLYSATQSLPQKRDELREAFEDIVIALRDMITAKVDDGCDRLFFLSNDELDSALSSMTLKRLVAIYQIISDAIRDLDRNVVIPTLLTDLAVKIKSA